MRKAVQLIVALAVCALAVSAALAQRPRSVSTTDSSASAPQPSAMPTPAPAPQTVKAKYEGGVFGYEKKLDGTLTFDDTNRRLVFRKEQKEILFIPYDAVTSAFADTKSKQPRAATIASSIPTIYGLPAHFIRHKVQYLTLQYRDPDTNVAGITSFKLENKQILASVLNTLAGKANLSPRGDIYVKRSKAEEEAAKP